MRPKGLLFDLKAFRSHRNLTQKEIAEAVKRPQSFLSAIEHGKRSAPSELLDDLSRIYKVDNISDYLSERPVMTFGSVEDVHNSIVNSPGGEVLVNEFGGKLSHDEIQRILDIEEIAWKKKLRDSTEEYSPPPAPQPQSDTSTVAELVKLLSKAEERAREAEEKVKELTKQVQDLQAQLPKKKR